MTTTMPTRTTRRAGSVRFAAYYKVETWDARICAWRPIPKAHDTEAAAEDGCPNGKRSRITEIRPGGRRVLREVEH